MVYSLNILWINMKSTVVTIKIDPQTKAEAQQAARELGMPLSVIIKAFLKQFSRTKSVSFSANEEIPNPRLQAVMKQAEKDWKSGKHSPIFKTGEEAVAWLEKQGI
jgi:addiction module RelB/DinJ family antitoxin